MEQLQPPNITPLKINKIKPSKSAVTHRPKTAKISPIEQAVNKVKMNTGSSLPIKRIDENLFEIRGKRVNVELLRNGKLMAIVGGGSITLESYLISKERLARSNSRSIESFESKTDNYAGGGGSMNSDIYSPMPITRLIPELDMPSPANLAMTEKKPSKKFK